jgi:hypothetical protein
MRLSDLHFFPLVWPFVLGLFLLMGLLIALIEVGILEYAYAKIGVTRRYLFAVLFLSLLGSYVTIPVAHLPGAASGYGELQSDARSAPVSLHGPLAACRSSPGLGKEPRVSGWGSPCGRGHAYPRKIQGLIVS